MTGEFWKRNEVGFVVVGLPSWINLDSVAPSGNESGVSFFTGWVVEVVGISLNDRRYLVKSSLEVVVSRRRSFVKFCTSKVGFS